jgi:hypothetical protein
VKHRTWTLCFLVLIFLARQSSSEISIGVPTSNTHCGKTSLPKVITEMLAMSRPEWEVQTISSLDNYDRDLWNKYHPNVCPGVVSGHFLGTRFTDYVVLLIPKSLEKKGYQVLLFSHSTKNGKFETQLVTKWSDDPGTSEVIWVAPRGEYSDFYSDKKISLKQDAFGVETLEATATIYYWSKGKIETVLVSD